MNRRDFLQGAGACAIVLGIPGMIPNVVEIDLSKLHMNTCVGIPDDRGGPLAFWQLSMPVDHAWTSSDDGRTWQKVPDHPQLHTPHTYVSYRYTEERPAESLRLRVIPA